MLTIYTDQIFLLTSFILTATYHTHSYIPHSQLQTTRTADKTGISAIYYKQYILSH